MENKQVPEEQHMGHMPDTTRDGTAHRSFGWQFESLPLAEAMGLARASRTSGRIQTERYGFTLHEPNFDFWTGFLVDFWLKSAPEQAVRRKFVTV